MIHKVIDKFKDTYERLLIRFHVIRIHPLILPLNSDINEMIQCIVGSSFYNRYIIYIRSGVYFEPEIHMKSYVSLRGVKMPTIKNIKPISDDGFIIFKDVVKSELNELNIQCDSGTGCIINVSNSPSKKSECKIVNTNVNTRQPTDHINFRFKD